jgi:hypothetical protein
MRKHGLPLRRILLCLLVGAALTSTSGLASAEPAGQVIALRGTATLERSGSRSALVSGAELGMGDWIETDPGARLKVRFADGSLVHLGENTRLRIDLAKFNAEGKRNILLEMPLGLLRAAAAKSKTAGSSFEVHTGIGYSAVRGTEWFMAAASGETRVHVLEGRVSVGTDFQSDQFPKLVEGGRWAVVSRKVGIAPIEDSAPGSLDSLIEQTEAAASNSATGTSVADAAETSGMPDAAADVDGSAIGPGNSDGSTDASGTSGTGNSSADDGSAAANGSSSNNSPNNSSNNSPNGSSGGGSNGGSSNGGSSNGGSGGSSNGGSSSSGNGGSSGSGSGKGDGKSVGSGKGGPGKFK